MFAHLHILLLFSIPVLTGCFLCMSLLCEFTFWNFQMLFSTKGSMMKPCVNVSSSLQLFSISLEMSQKHSTYNKDFFWGSPQMLKVYTNGSLMTDGTLMMLFTSKKQLIEEIAIDGINWMRWHSLRKLDYISIEKWQNMLLIVAFRKTGCDSAPSFKFY